MPGKDTNIGAKRAREARERLGLDDASPVPCIVGIVEERAGLPVIVGALPDGFAGALWRNGVGSIVWVNGAQSVTRQRFTVAHDLGHWCCDHGSTPIDTDAMITGQAGDYREVQANAFAAQFLAPAAGVRELVDRDPNLEEVVALAARFGISPVAAVFRCSTLGLLSEARYAQLLDEIDEGLHQYLNAEPLHDLLAETAHPRLPHAPPPEPAPPRLPPSLAGSALAGVLAGRVSVGAAASAAGCPEETLG